MHGVFLYYLIDIVTILEVHTGIFIALAAGDPKARVPYASLSQHNVKNFPSELKFGHPSTFGNDALCRILDCAEEIQFDCM